MPRREPGRPSGNLRCWLLVSGGPPLRAVPVPSRPPLTGAERGPASMGRTERGRGAGTGTIGGRRHRYRRGELPRVAVGAVPTGRRPLPEPLGGVAGSEGGRPRQPFSSPITLLPGRGRFMGPAAGRGRGRVPAGCGLRSAVLRAPSAGAAVLPPLTRPRRGAPTPRLIPASPQSLKALRRSRGRVPRRGERSWSQDPRRGQRSRCSRLSTVAVSAGGGGNRQGGGLLNTRREMELPKIGSQGYFRINASQEEHQLDGLCF